MKKTSFCIIVVDGEKFIGHQLKDIYPHAHEIIICEGGDNFWNELHGRRRSSDKTLEIIKNFPDPKNKIKLIQKDWKNKNQMTHEYSKHVTGDYVWHVDVDEFVDSTKIPTIMNLFDTYPKAQGISLPHYVFWGDTKTIALRANASGRWIPNWLSAVRIFKAPKPGWSIHHIPTTGYYNNNTGQVVYPTVIPGADLVRMNLWFYHFSYCFKQDVVNKIKYYDFRHKGSKCIKKNWLENVFLKIEDNKEEWIRSGFDVQPVALQGQSAAQRLAKFTGTLPDNLKKLAVEIDSD
jgi:hypothetical protein